MNSQWGLQKLLQGLVLHELTADFSIFKLFKLNELKSSYQKHVNQIILCRTTLWSLALRIFEAFVRILLIVNLFLNQTLLTFLLCVICLNDSDNFSVRGYHPLIQKNSSTHTWSCSLCERRTSFCTGIISGKLCRFLFLFSTGFTSLSVLLLFLLLITFFSFVHSFWLCFIYNR